jgi:hypothetical protein
MIDGCSGARGIEGGGKLPGYRFRAASKHLTPSDPTTAEWDVPGGMSSRSPGRRSMLSPIAGRSKRMLPLAQ